MRAVLGAAKAVLTIIRFKLTSMIWFAMSENVLFYFILDSEVYKKKQRTTRCCLWYGVQKMGIIIRMKGSSFYMSPRERRSTSHQLDISSYRPLSNKQMMMTRKEDTVKQALQMVYTYPNKKSIWTGRKSPIYEGWGASMRPGPE